MIDQFEGGDANSFSGLTTETDRGMGRRVIIKRFASQTGGNTPLGVAPTKSFYLIETACNLKVMNGKDVLAAGGIYAYGDIQVRGRLPIFGANGKTGQNVDTMIFDGMQYQQVGIPFPVPGGGGVVEYQTVWRKANS
jgi:hypothetical protein